MFSLAFYERASYGFGWEGAPYSPLAPASLKFLSPRKDTREGGKHPWALAAMRSWFLALDALAAACEPDLFYGLSDEAKKKKNEDMTGGNGCLDKGWCEMERSVSAHARVIKMCA